MKTSPSSTHPAQPQASLAADVTDFFRNFALHVLMAAHVDPNNPRAFKQAMLDHYEEIYPRFSLTQVFRDNNGRARHEEMVSEYRRCFSLLLAGRLP
ncbi:hypothetical protein Prede_0511 [Prevotella dentalis DSM 3688]|uniref:Uncharacterized protein n=1 Tax=Prevotella dentalis (strain ATCC 49559 / DSM 3688 / JCM 13448 / NCTC 12043 / ES 2772) TaxID=908937 RepID=F9D085_PREDD|nr:hypothetical protein [Prevotella dentalis]AGB27879.1 hypothetical protein Prede_0511 [Prevotella dentalis DSM 3688]EGQ17178.1 hypothetical protein HMPREF9136_0262 [Prevotella dentalis DSM 3688]